MEVAQVRKRVQQAIGTARERAQAQRQRTAEAEKSYEVFIRDVATPLVRQLANALKVDGYAFTVFTPAEGLRLASDRGRDDFIELRLDLEDDVPHVRARISRTRGSRTLLDDRAVKGNAPPEAITEDDLLDFLLATLEPWLAR